MEEAKPAIDLGGDIWHIINNLVSISMLQLLIEMILRQILTVTSYLKTPAVLCSHFDGHLEPTKALLIPFFIVPWN